MHRRDFLRRTAALIPLLHPAAGLLSPLAAATSEPPMRLAELHLRTDRPEELSRFYREVLRLPVDHPGDAVRVQAGSTEIRFSAAAEGTSPFYHFAFNIPENKLQAAIDWASSRVTLLTHPRTGKVIVNFPNWNANSVYFFDPAGNLLEFIARHNLPNAAPGPFSERDFLCASEIGLVVDQVPATVTWMREQLHQEPYTGYVSQDFSAVGSEHGLFIVVRRGRDWLMTDKPADVFATDVALASDGAEQVLPGFPYRIRA